MKKIHLYITFCASHNVKNAPLSNNAICFFSSLVLFYFIYCFDHWLSTKSHDTSFVVLLMYVDNVILVGNTLSKFGFIKSTHKSYGIKDSGPYFLRLENEISLCQSKNCFNILRSWVLASLSFKLLSVPLDLFFRLHQSSGESYSNISSCSKLIGKLLYLTTTQPDISFVMRQLSE